MNIIINCLLLNRKYSGIQHYIESLLINLNNLNSKYEIELLLPESYVGPLVNSNFSIMRADISSGRSQRILCENIILPRHLFKKQNKTLYHSPAYILPLLCPAIKVVTIHDLIALKYPQFCTKESEYYFKLMLPYTIKRADKIIAVSEIVKQEIIENFKISPDKIDVIYHGVRENFKRINDIQILQQISKKYNLPHNYMLFVGNLEPKKNLDGLLRALAIVKKNKSLNIKLVIAGQNAWKFDTIYQCVNDLHLHNEVLFLGYVPENDLPILFNLASFSIFPSLYEGFGLPAIEAMACGTPVIVANTGALPEVTGNCAFPVDPYNIEKLAEAIYLFSTDASLREHYAKSGLQHIKKYSWEMAAVKTLQLYENL